MIQPELAVLRGGESTVHRNPYETHNALDAIRTQDADLAVRKTKNFFIVKRPSLMDIQPTAQVVILLVLIGEVYCQYVYEMFMYLPWYLGQRDNKMNGFPVLLHRKWFSKIFLLGEKS